MRCVVEVRSAARLGGRVPSRLVVCSELGAGEALRLFLRAAAWCGAATADVVCNESGRLGTARADGAGFSVVVQEVEE
jgi:hypothetical protein